VLRESTGEPQDRAVESIRELRQEQSEISVFITEAGKARIDCKSEKALEEQTTIVLNDFELELWKKLKRESTVDLVYRIVEDSNRSALKVLFETRKLFRTKAEPQLSIGQYLIKLRDKLAPPAACDIAQSDLADCAYDLTVSKYISFPDPHAEDDIKFSRYKGIRVDCRKYYSAFLRKIKRIKSQGKIRNQAEEELYAGRILQNLIYKNFLRAKLDCKRVTPFSIRYIWEVMGKNVYLWYPSYLTARKFKGWLEENIEITSFKAPDVQKRIQSLIYANFRRGHHVSLDVPDVGQISVMGDAHSLMECYEGFAFVGNLADRVALEKAKNIDKLRPAIKKLGKKRIQRMILQIFTALASGEYKPARIAAQYGINKSTFSRFAGRNWKEEIENFEIARVPDLWRNTAVILRDSPEFIETVLFSGVAGDLKIVLDIIERKTEESNGG